VFSCLLVAAFGGLGYRLVDVQVLQHETLRRTADRFKEGTQVQPSRRGEIYDARGQLMATSIRVKTVRADPRLIGKNREALAQALSPILGTPWEQLAKKMERRLVVDEYGQRQDLKKGVDLAREVPLEDWDRIQQVIREFKLKPKTIFTAEVDGERRYYPNGTLAAHVLGFAGPREQPRADQHAGELAGKSGIEASLDEALSGTRGRREVMHDVHRNELVAMRSLDVASRPGLGVVLTLDAGVQHIVETEIESAYLEHGPISVTCVVVRPRTGEILAMANVPTFDPNRPGAFPQENWRNRAIADVAEPGSTFKALVVAGALEEGVVTLDTEVNCENGYFTYKRQPLRDVHPYGMLRVEDVIAKSSNIGAAKIGLLLGEQRLHRCVRSFGIGEPTRVPLGGEVSGFFQPVKNWSKISAAWIPMGHEVATTPLQMVMAMSAIANGGKLMRPMLVKALMDEQGIAVANFEPTMVRQVVSDAAARQMKQALKTAVAAGTGKRANLEFYEVAGKTGTAQKIVDGRYSNTKHFVSFIGFLPADAPELCISVVMDEPRKGTYGGETAAPVWKRIAEKVSSYLSMPPSRGVEPPLLTGPPGPGLRDRL
jgi:cell division protein FtsI/penicillin-binding protein 2